MDDTRQVTAGYLQLLIWLNQRFSFQAWMINDKSDGKKAKKDKDSKKEKKSKKDKKAKKDKKSKKEKKEKEKESKKRHLGDTQGRV